MKTVSAETVFSRTHTVSGALINRDEVILAVGTRSTSVVRTTKQDIRIQLDIEYEGNIRSNICYYISDPPLGNVGILS